MDKEIISELEALVEEISECHSSVAMEIVNKFHTLTQNNWTEKEYIRKR